VIGQPAVATPDLSADRSKALNFVYAIVRQNSGEKPMLLRGRVVSALVFVGFLQMPDGAACLGKVNRHDTVIMKNGDRLTGEVKKLEQGVLYIETDYFSGSVGVDWLQVEKVESTANLPGRIERSKEIDRNNFKGGG
jgi:hypothetical protein